MYFQDLILALQIYWGEKGCTILQPYDMEVGAGTSSPATLLGLLRNPVWNIAYVQPSRRPSDGRYAQNPNRNQHYYQFQVILKPSPDNVQALCIASLEKVGIRIKDHDIRFVEDDWKNPTLGAWGLGWEVWCDGMEILQFTFMQQIGGIDCNPIPCEITYGLERLAMYIQNIDSLWEIQWNNKGVKYKDIFMQSEKEYSEYNFSYADTDILLKNFEDSLKECIRLAEQKLIYPAYDQCLKASHSFNLLESRGVLSVTERARYISKVRNAAKKCCDELLSLHL